MKKIIALLFLLVLILNSCGESGTDPNKQLKSPFEMIWTADTIAYEGSAQTLMTSMWASSPNDVWIVGHNDRSLGEVYHFNGSNWKEIDPTNDVTRSAKSLHKVMGLNSSNVWIVGQRDAYIRKDIIINWNGTKWKEHNLNLQVRPISLFVNKSNDIWIGCDSAVVLHYDGVKWERDIPKLNIPQESVYFINGIVVRDNIIYLNVAVFNVKIRKDIFYFIKGTFNNWTVVDSMYQENPSSIIKWGDWGLSLGKDNNVYSFGKFGVWEFINNIWSHIIPINYTMQNVFALNENYKIAVGVYGMVWFHNGTQWQQLTRFFTPNGDIHIYDAWTDGHEIFLLGNTTGAWPQKTIVWRGK